jgi:hypothetical protein
MLGQAAAVTMITSGEAVDEAKEVMVSDRDL